MAIDMFIKIGSIEGESVDKTHKGKIDVLAWSWGMSQSGSAHVGGGMGAGKVNVQDISFTKWVDKSTTNLMQACCKGSHFADAVLIVRKAGETPLEYIKISLKNVLVTAVSTGGSGGEDRLTENVTLNFEEFKIEYQEQNEKGGVKSKPEFAWNIAKNVNA
jgi:type VI secretion system secreted protein Hcp